MSYLVLARKWRPRSFDTLVGQDHVVRALTHALSTQRLHHAWLFTGTRGVGKTTLSRILAKSLNCETGITATPCGVCRACTEIDAGRFVDYVELDAASNRGVDEMTQLLEQAVYSPGAGRFKVYMIDEVHMLTGHAFNAMLKTLEEPPPHVKFILATTDPQKIPVTVLSRCLQFNLKQMTGEAIVSHLTHVLQEENIPFEIPALRLIGQAAAGSMRDALSLTDQAIAYSAGNLTAEAVQGMLGTIDQRHLIALLGALSAGDAPKVIAVADDLAARGLSYSGALADMAVLLSRIAVAQRLGKAVPEDDPAAEDILALSRTMHPDQIQLFYSVAVHSRQELSLAPDEYAGFVMACLRMLALGPNPGLPSLPNGSHASGETSASGHTDASGRAGSASHSVTSSNAVPSDLAATSGDAEPSGTEQTGEADNRATSSDSTPLLAGKASSLTGRRDVVSDPETVNVSSSAASPDAASAADDVPVAAASDEPPAWEEMPAQEGHAGKASTALRAATGTASAEYKPQATQTISAASLGESRTGTGATTNAIASSDVAFESPPSGLVNGPGDGVADQDRLGSEAMEDIPIELNDNFEMVGFDDESVLSQIPMDELASAVAAAPAGKRRGKRSGQSELAAMTRDRWPELAAKLPVTGLASELARQSEWIGCTDNKIQLRVAVRSLAQTQGKARLQTVLSEHFGTVVDLQVEFGATGDDTAHAVAQAERAARQQQAEQDAENDPFVQALIRDFGARIVPGSVKAVLPSAH